VELVAHCGLLIFDFRGSDLSVGDRLIARAAAAEEKDKNVLVA
jgi:hypothetical protein